jgi:hypothetical protein
MKITITLRGSLRKYLDGGEAPDVTVPDGCTCAEALRTVGIDWESIPTFGFVAVNGMRVMITDRLSPGDELKAYSKIGGG